VLGSCQKFKPLTPMCILWDSLGYKETRWWPGAMWPVERESYKECPGPGISPPAWWSILVVTLPSLAPVLLLQPTLCPPHATSCYFCPMAPVLSSFPMDLTFNYYSSVCLHFTWPLEADRRGRQKRPLATSGLHSSPPPHPAKIN
jgi:hypothetical protein